MIIIAKFVGLITLGSLIFWTAYFYLIDNGEK
jgi:hypothetical protein